MGSEISSEGRLKICAHNVCWYRHLIPFCSISLGKKLGPERVDTSWTSVQVFLEAVDDTRKVKVFRTVRASDGLQRAKLFWYHFLGDLSSELETILDGTCTVAKNGLT